MTTATSQRTPANAPRSDVRALWLGIAFSAVFTALIALADSRLDSIVLLPDSGASWYYWKLPEPTLWSRATAWGFYALHQITIWGLIYYAQRSKLTYTAGLHRVNVVALAANALFIGLHFVQTHIWYDGLAQDVSIWSSQGSVIVLLVAVLVMENRRRGMFFGKRAPIGKAVIDVVKRYHGYVFAWAIVYTFWYHPMVSTPGHLIGFFYMFLLMLQGSLFFTRLHINRYWTLVQEVTVLVHGTIVAVFQGLDLWPMFLFGFVGIFVITQMHGIGLKRWMKWAIGALFVGGVIGVYYGDWAALNEVIRIPLIEYLAALVLAGLIWLGLQIAGLLRRDTGAMEVEPTSS